MTENNPLLDLFLKLGKGKDWPILVERYYYDPKTKTIYIERWIIDMYIGTYLRSQELQTIDLGPSPLQITESDWVQANMYEGDNNVN